MRTNHGTKLDGIVGSKMNKESVEIYNQAIEDCAAEVYHHTKFALSELIKSDELAEEYACRLNDIVMELLK